MYHWYYIWSPKYEILNVIYISAWELCVLKYYLLNLVLQEEI
jgi:hypothetical protein